MKIHSNSVWAFVLNPLEIQCDLPFSITEKCILRRATQEEIHEIKDKLLKLQPSGFDFFTSYEYEYVPFVEMGKGYGYIGEKLPHNQQRYYVVDSDDGNITCTNLHLSSQIASVSLEINTLYFMRGSGYAWSAAALLHQGVGFAATAPKRVTNDDLTDLKRAYEIWLKRTNFEDPGCEKYPELRRAALMLDSLRMIHRNSEFSVIGLFAIIEMLITHNPKLEDRGDSITHQMQSKIPLLSRRFTKAIPLTDFFDTENTKTIWKAMYAYRSSIAHGGMPNFTTGPLQVLKSPENANSFLALMVRRLLRYAFEEPELYRDLKEC